MGAALNPPTAMQLHPTTNAAEHSKRQAKKPPAEQVFPAFRVAASLLGFRSPIVRFVCSAVHRALFGENGLRAAATVLVGLAALAARGQTADASPPGASQTSAVSNEAKEGGDWSFSASLYAYFVPDDREYVQPTFAADRDWLHLEARYNYEDLETGSAWVGYNLGGGNTLTWELTPMLGGVFGNTTGIAPGYRGSLSWWKLELHSEGEYVIDTADTSASFFYNWSELTLAPVEWLRFGLVTQRTRLYDSDRDLQRGLLLGFAYRAASLTTCVFNPDESEPTLVVALSVDF